MINYDRKVKYVLNDESSEAAQALLEALSSLSKAWDFPTWNNVLAKIESSESTLGAFIQQLHNEAHNDPS